MMDMQRKVWKQVKKVYQKISFGGKLIFVYLLVILVPLIASTSISYILSSRIIRNRTYDYLQNLATVTMSKVEMSVENVENTAFNVSGNEEIQSLLYLNLTEEDRIERYNRYREIYELLSNYVLLSGEVYSIYIQAEDGQLYSYTKINQASPSEEVWEAEQDWICEDGHIYLRSSIYKYVGLSAVGTMVLDVMPSVFYDIVNDLYSDVGSVVYVVDEKNTIISGKNLEMTGETLQDELLEVVGSADTFETAVLDGIKYAVYTGNEISNGWKLVLAVPESYFLEDIRQLQLYILAILAVTSLLAIGMVVVTGRRITRPIKRLSEMMEQFGQGNFDVSFQIEGEDEIAVLTRTFNQMVVDIRTLVNEVYEQEMMKQEVEMRSLQMQINPHFLYNTLDTINWIARMHGVDEIGEMTWSLGNLMRYSLSQKDFVTVEEEIGNLKNYIGIQNVRYGDRMEVSCDVEPELLQTFIPKLLLQPILENAIVHGVEDKIDLAHIQIRIYHEEDELYMIVEDDGVGMTQEMIESLLDMNTTSVSKNHTSIGVKNVNRRIQKVYGAGYGLMIQSQLGSGTKVTLRMKVLREVPSIHLRYND